VGVEVQSVNFVVAVLLVVLGVTIALRLRQVRYEKLAEAERRVHRARIAWRLGRRVPREGGTGGFGDAW
jgi:hypothetical protein